MYHCGNFWCRVGLGVMVLNGIEAALWDLRGKLEGKPVYELLGGCQHERLPAYATGGPANYPLDELARKIEFYTSLGFRGVKVGAATGHEEGPTSCQKTRGSCGRRSKCWSREYKRRLCCWTRAAIQMSLVGIGVPWSRSCR